MAAFPNASEAARLVRELEEIGGSAEHRVESVALYKRLEDWQVLDPDLDSSDGIIPGLHQTKTSLPDFTGQRCIGVNRITRQRLDQEPVSESIELLWATGATVLLGVGREFTMLVSNQPWASPSEGQGTVESASTDSENELWRSQPVDASDPLSRLLGETVHTFSVAENAEGYVMAMEVGFGTIGLRVAVVDADLRVTVVEK